MVAPDRATVVARQKQRFGGIKVGSAFFGWLTATGMAVLLIALLAAAGVAFGVATGTTSTRPCRNRRTAPAPRRPSAWSARSPCSSCCSLAYYCGGYVAGRMARFNGLKQGLAVWLWGV